MAGTAAGCLTLEAHRKKLRRWKRHVDHVSDASGSPAPQPGDILLFHNAHGESLFITVFTHSPFYHAALYAGDQHVVEARPEGVIYNHLRGRENDFIVLPAPDGRGPEALAWAKGKIGAPYDHTDMLVIVLEHLFTHWHLNYVPPGKYTCAEFVADAYSKVGILLVPDRDLADIVPADLARTFPTVAGLASSSDQEK